MIIKTIMTPKSLLNKILFLKNLNSLIFFNIIFNVISGMLLQRNHFRRNCEQTTEKSTIISLLKNKPWYLRNCSYLLLKPIMRKHRYKISENVISSNKIQKQFICVPKSRVSLVILYKD